MGLIFHHRLLICSQLFKRDLHFLQMPPKHMFRVFDQNRCVKRMVCVDCDASGIDVVNAGMN